MTTEALAQRAAPAAAILERVIIGGDLAPLQPAERVHYYRAVCESLGVNPLTKPFEYLQLNGKLVLYARKDCTDQLRARDGISITEVLPVAVGDLYVVTVKASDGEGRTDVATGAVNVQGLRGEALANAMMKAETKAKRRVTLSLCGLGMLDETEIPDTPGAETIEVDPATGEVKDAPAERPLVAPLISEAQVRRLYAIAGGARWSDDQAHELLSSYRYDSAKAIRVDDYDAICDRLKAGPPRA